MRSEIKIYSRGTDEIQRVQVVRWDDWSKLDFLHLDYKEASLDCFRDIYQNYLVPACPWIFCNMILFQLPQDLNIGFLFKEDIKEKFFYKSKKYGKVGDKLTIASMILQKGVKLVGGKPVFKDAVVKKFWQLLEERGCVRIVCGKLPFTKVIPVGKVTGYLSECVPDAAMKVNASFFIMDPFDCATIYDQVGTVFGLCVKDGIVQNPPLYNREALLVKRDGSVCIEEADVKNLEVEINGRRYQHGKNAMIYTRPERAKTPGDKRKKIVIIGCRVAAVKDSGSVEIPASGFVLCPLEECNSSIGKIPRYEKRDAQPIENCANTGIKISEKCGKKCEVIAGDSVFYHGMEDVAFGIQVGNSMIRNGVKTEHFISKFYNIYKLERVPFPPSLYPMNFEKARAARMALGADKDGKPMLFWAEGAGKLGYKAGEDSTGASLTEMAEIAADLGMVNAVNLDGGGSAQILLKNKKALRISDRNKNDNTDAERLVPLGLVVR